MKFKRICSVLTVLMVVAAMLLAPAYGLQSGESSGEEASTLPENFYFMEDVTIGGETTGGKYYIYISPNLHDFDILSNFLNGVFYVYPDEAPQSQEEAYALIESLGLVEIADEMPASIVIALPANGESWSEDDLAVYYESQYYLAGGVISMTDEGPVGEYERRTMNSLQYIIAEGSGATFVNNVLSQNASRIAGILTFGGEIDETLDTGYAVPAYLVNAAPEAVDYWCAANETDTQEGDTYYNSAYSTKKVVVADGGDSFDADTIRTAYDSFLSYICRLAVAANLVLDSQDLSEWVLMDWPNLEEIGLAEIYHTMAGEDREYNVYDYVPESVSESDEAVPLVLVLHGGSDDPINIVYGCGWANLAVEENLIVISPDYTSGDTAFLASVIEYAIETYNIDTTRIYVTGFSMGGMNTALMAQDYPELIAAIAPMGGITTVEDTDGLFEGWDMPSQLIKGGLDSTYETESGAMAVQESEQEGVRSLMLYNELIDQSVLADFDETAYWGYAADGYETVENHGLLYDISSYYKDGYTAPFAQLVILEDAGHANADYMARVAWDFMKNFARVDGQVVEIG